MSRVVWSVVALLGLIYVADYLSLQLRIPRREPFGVVEVQRYYEIALKNRKTEYMRDQPRSQPCVRSLFPHYGESPCWYLERHPRQTIKVGSNPSDFWRIP